MGYNNNVNIKFTSRKVDNLLTVFSNDTIEYVQSSLLPRDAPTTDTLRARASGGGASAVGVGAPATVEASGGMGSIGCSCGCRGLPLPPFPTDESAGEEAAANPTAETTEAATA